jgi:hypothetical protein
MLKQTTSKQQAVAAAAMRSWSIRDVLVVLASDCMVFFLRFLSTNEKAAFLNFEPTGMRR